MSFYSNKNDIGLGCSKLKSTSVSNGHTSNRAFPSPLLSVRAWKVAVISLCFLHPMKLTLTLAEEQEPQEQNPWPEKERQNMKPKILVNDTEFEFKYQSYRDGKESRSFFFSGDFGPIYQRRKRGDSEEENRITGKTPELVRNADPGLQVHRHHIKTKDNYVLTLFRIINRRCGVNASTFPILFQHGLMGTSDDFLLLDPDYSLPISLALYGHDVWLSNSRGNEYSKSHEFFNTYDPRYWNFSFHEMGNYDLPTLRYLCTPMWGLGKRGVFEFIKRTTKPTILDTGRRQKGLYYIGHGLGTTLLYVCLSQNPDYNGYIKAAFSLGPMAFMSKSRSTLRNLIPLIKHYQTFPKDGPVSFTAIKDYLYGAAPELCTVKQYGRGLCGPEIFTFLPDGSSQIRKETVPVILAHSPSSTSMKTLIHVLQLLDADYFREFDYGPIKNFQRYNQTTPFKYSLFRVIIPFINIYGQADNLIDQKDAEKTVAKLGTQIYKANLLVFNSNYADFVYSEPLSIIISRLVYFLFDLTTLEQSMIPPPPPGIEGGQRNTTKLSSKDTASCRCPSECAEGRQ